MGRSARVVLSWVVSVSFLLMPYSTLHAHVSDHEHTHVHAGHFHDPQPDHDARSLDQVVSITVPATASTSMAGWAGWLPVVWVSIVVALSVPLLTALPRPPSRDTEPISRRSRRQPPLRGPPASIPAL